MYFRPLYFGIRIPVFIKFCYFELYKYDSLAFFNSELISESLNFAYHSGRAVSGFKYLGPLKDLHRGFESY
jgi:hypothetical protein